MERDLDLQFQKDFENCVETVDIMKSQEGQAIDTVFEYETAHGNIDSEKLAEAVNEKFDVNFSVEDVEMIREVAQKEMSMDIEVDFSKDMNLEDIKELLKDDLDKLLDNSHSQENSLSL